MTQKENSGYRDLTFSGWMRQKLPDSKTGYLVSDLDFCIYQYKKKDIMMLEIKQYKKELKKWQRELITILHQALLIGLKEVGYKYHGWHLIQFEKQFFNDGWCKLDNRIITEQKLIKFLSLE